MLEDLRPFQDLRDFAGAPDEDDITEVLIVADDGSPIVADDGLTYITAE